jgi:hypothetical protein
MNKVKKMEERRESQQHRPTTSDAERVAALSQVDTNSAVTDLKREKETEPESPTPQVVSFQSTRELVRS